MINNLKTVPIVWILLLTFFASLPFLKPGLYTMHDDQQIARLFVFDEALRAGQFPVRWVDELGFGFGYPLFVFYPPLVYILGEIFHLVGFGFISSTKLVFFLSILGSGLAMYFFVREIFGRKAAITSALFYMLVPYRAIDVYIRGALAESFSFVWLPLILWSFYKLLKTQKSIYIYLSGIFLALLMITHNLIFLPFMLILPFYLLFLIWNSSNRRLSIVNCFWSVVISIGLSAFFWLPALLEKKFTIVDQLLLVNLASYKIHFVYPQQLWNSLWGFGGSAAGLADGISFKIGKLHVISSISAVILSMIYIFKSRRLSKLSTVNCQLSTVFFLLFLLSAFMTTFYSKFIWDLITPLQYLQFPWRFLTFTALFSSILAGAFIYLLRVPILQLVASITLVILLFLPNFKLFKPQYYRPDLTDQKATSHETIAWDVSQSSFEYLPKGVELDRSPLGTNLVRLARADISKTKVEVVEGDLEINNLVARPSKIKFSTISDNVSKLQIKIYNFPGWQARVDNLLVPISDNNSLKLITLDVPSGSHQIELEFKNTPIRSLANLISVMSILAIIIVILKPWLMRFINSK